MFEYVNVVSRDIEMAAAAGSDDERLLLARRYHVD